MLCRCGCGCRTSKWRGSAIIADDSDGALEALDRTNNLLQVLRRKAHGFTSYTNFEARGLIPT